MQIEIRQTDVFAAWFAGLRDRQGALELQFASAVSRSAAATNALRIAISRMPFNWRERFS